MVEFVPAVLPTESRTNVGFRFPSFVLDEHQEASTLKSQETPAGMSVFARSRRDA